ncbi:hypothetical protein BRARA_J00230 [Brassica rapa]|uniref:Vacuolar protein sorting-associated protein 62 n=2 Tax=Brassica TaxID=3705 RepID=A0ABQ8BL52_BRANA|nr:uncharacterized protein BNAA10G02370D [Brassica napus]KAH0905544.1 hypothetical protein HID58_037371 [Brassica napus]RID40167.1 hypothetical protein BRARA_J00230 [Brassica rapa]CAG7909030.1 unnamed protein product [Brassica rapa]VDD16811.1 unnamed protein product [Brassica rapa]
MLGYKCLHWDNVSDSRPLKDPETFSLPAPIPQWPPDQGFGSRTINLGKLEVIKITDFEFIWRYRSTENNNKCISFYKPKGHLPKDFHCLGHYCQSDSHPLRGYLLAARDLAASLEQEPALAEPLDFTPVWSSNDSSNGYFWLPQPPEGYKSMGFVVTKSSAKPELNEVRCVRADLTDKCETHKLIVTAVSESLTVPLFIWRTRPSDRGMWGKGVSTGTFFCRTRLVSREQHLSISCLKNLDSGLHAMPNLDQIQALIQHYGPTLIFHPDETYLPSSVSWFFSNGAVLCQKGNPICELIDENGSNLPQGGSNDKQYWIDLPFDDDHVKRGNIESSKLYVHVKPALGGTFTDLVFWIFCPFNGPATLKLGLIDVSLVSIGQHVCDWEHFTLRISNYSGELYSIYFSQHSGGEWIESYDLQFVTGTNKAVVYSSKHGHASFPRAGVYLQGSTTLGIGIRNDTARSDLLVDSSSRYEIVAAEYLGAVVKEPSWLQYMREWGPKIVYDSREEIERLASRFPRTVGVTVGNVLRKLPVELSGEEGPTGPKEKNNWYGDERW